MILLAGLAVSCAKPTKTQLSEDQEEGEAPTGDSNNEFTKVIGDTYLVVNPRISGQWVVAKNSDINVKYICEVRKRQSPPTGTGYVWETLKQPIRGVYVNISSVGGRTEIRPLAQNVIIREVHCLNKKLVKELSGSEISTEILADEISSL